MKLLAGSLLVLPFVGVLLGGLLRPHALRNVTPDVTGAFSSGPSPCWSAHADGSVTTGASFARNYPLPPGPYPRGWRPGGGVVDGQGCCDRSVGACECDYCACNADGSFGYGVGAYLFFAKYTLCEPVLGGQLIVENRGRNGSLVLPLLATLVGALALLALLARQGARLLGPRFSRWAEQPLAAPRKAPRRGEGAAAAAGRLWDALLHEVGWVLELRRGEAGVLLWLVAWLLACGAYLYGHAHVNNLVGKVSRAFGGVGVGIVPLLLFPAMRHSPLLPAFGTSFDRALKFHRLLGGAFFACATVHMVAMYVKYVDVYMRGDPKLQCADGNSTDDSGACADRSVPARVFVNQVSRAAASRQAAARLVQWGVGFPHGPPLAGLLAWLVMLAMVVAARFRRSRWELFLLVHMGYTVVFAMVFVHYPTTILLCTPAIAAYAWDLAQRYRIARSGGEGAPKNASGGAAAATVVSATWHAAAGVTELVIEPGPHMPSLDAPMTFATIHCDEIDLRSAFAPRGLGVEEHPFSISSRTFAREAGDRRFTLHIKDMGEGQWTNRLGKKAQSGALDGIACRVDGPFGRASPALGAHRAVFLVSGGMGVTPMLNALQAVVESFSGGGAVGQLLPRDERSRLVFVWSVRSRSQAQPFLPLLQALVAKAKRVGAPVTVRVFETKPASAPKPREPEDHPLLTASAPLLQPLLADQDQHEHADTTPLPSAGLHERVSASELGGGTVTDNPGVAAADDLEGGVEIAFEPGRPDVKSIVQPDVDLGETRHDLAVYTCGPPPMVASLATLSKERGIVCHAETFLF